MSLSNLYSEIFTIINQIPVSQTVATKKNWKKHRLEQCGKRDGLYDKSSGQMFYKANTWTAYLGDWQGYKRPVWVDGGYYTLTDMEQEKYFTANVGDLLIFADIEDEVPSTLQEFNTLRDKYKDNGGIITQSEVYIQFTSYGEPWKTNHIEVMKG